jgi:hypothetical protein
MLASANTFRVHIMAAKALVSGTRCYSGGVLPCCILQREPANLSDAQTTPRYANTSAIVRHTNSVGLLPPSREAYGLAR